MEATILFNWACLIGFVLTVIYFVKFLHLCRNVAQMQQDMSEHLQNIEESLKKLTESFTKEEENKPN